MMDLMFSGLDRTVSYYLLFIIYYLFFLLYSLILPPLQWVLQRAILILPFESLTATEQLLSSIIPQNLPPENPETYRHGPGSGAANCKSANTVRYSPERDAPTDRPEAGPYSRGDETASIDT